MNIEVSLASQREFISLARWFGEQRVGLRDEFESTVENALDQIGATPNAFPSRGPLLRRFLARPFLF